jgi:uncharacterized protein VirK/YbjX
MVKNQKRPYQLPVDTPHKFGTQGPIITSYDASIPAPQPYKRTGFFKWLFLIVQQKGSWSPIRVASELMRCLISIGSYREIHKLLKLRPFNEIAQNNPGFAFKYVVPNYLARSFTVSERSSCFLHHYRRIQAALPESALRQLLQGTVTLYEMSEGSNYFAITMGLSEPKGHLEGELSLDLRLDGENVFNLSFTIVPGWVVSSNVAEVLLISRLQRTLGSRNQIRLIRNAFHEFFPSKLLLAALQGFAAAFGIRELVAVSATNQTSHGEKYAAISKSSYDDLFAALRMATTRDGFYCSSIPISSKPLASLMARNRARARKRRAIRQEIQSACSAHLLRTVDRAPTRLPA